MFFPPIHMDSALYFSRSSAKTRRLLVARQYGGLSRTFPKYSQSTPIGYFFCFWRPFLFLVRFFFSRRAHFFFTWRLLLLLLPVAFSFSASIRVFPGYKFMKFPEDIVGIVAQECLPEVHSGRGSCLFTVIPCVSLDLVAHLPVYSSARLEYRLQIPASILHYLYFAPITIL